MAAKAGAYIHKNGIVANGVELVFRKWVKPQNEIAAVFADTSTAFAHVSTLTNARNTEQCRLELKLGNNVDMAIICTVTSVHSHSWKGGSSTVWICSDLDETSLKLSIYGTIPDELGIVDKGSVIAVLNPDMNDISKDYNFRGISIKNCDNILLIGEIDGLSLCKAVTTKGAACKNMVYVHNQGEFCHFHLKKQAAGTRLKKKAIRTTTGASDAVIMKGIEEGYRLQEAEPVFHNFEFRPTEPPRPEKVLSRLGSLGSLMSKVMQNRNGLQQSTVSTVAHSSNEKEKPCKYRRREELPDLNKQFETAVSSLKLVINMKQRDDREALNLIQKLGRRADHVDKEVIYRTDILKICSSLLDHQSETLAIETLKLRRFLKKRVQASDANKHHHGHMGNVKRTKTVNRVNNENNVEEINSILNITSSVDAYLDRGADMDQNDTHIAI